MNTWRQNLAAIIVAAMALPSPEAAANEDEPVHLEPQSPWQLDYAEARCRLARSFGEGDEATIFWLEQYGPSTKFAWLVAGPAVDRFRARRETNVQFGPNFPEWQFRYQRATLEGFGASISGTGPDAPPVDEDEDEGIPIEPVGLPHLDPETGRELLWLRLDQKFTQPVVLELGRMDKAFQAMNQCVENLVAYWGVDVEAQKRRFTVPQFSNIGQVARKIQEYYPSKAARSGSQANFHLRILVNDKGQAVDCTLTNITLAANFDMQRHPCQVVLDNAEFEPAKDQDGNPIASFYETRIVYQIGRPSGRW